MAIRELEYVIGKVPSPRKTGRSSDTLDFNDSNENDKRSL